MTRSRDARHAPLAARLSGLSEEDAAGKLIGREVAMHWLRGLEDNQCGRALVRTAANLIVRFCPTIRLTSRSDFALRLAADLVAIDGGTEPLAKPDSDALVVHLGGGRRADVTASSGGWTAYVSGEGHSLPLLGDSRNVIGAHAAGALVASQVFASVLPLNPAVAGISPTTAYSAYEFGPAGNDGPDLGSAELREGTLLAGAGAVGQACADVLVSAGTSGTMNVVDKGTVDDETNLNRSVLAVESDLEDLIPKVYLVRRRAVGSRLIVQPFHETIAKTIERVEAGQMAWPRVVASALDNREARYELQSLWPDLMLEGATGDSMVQVFRHEFSDQSACLRCLHPRHGVDRSYVESMAAATGLDAARLGRALRGAEDTIQPRDIDIAPPALREVFAQNIGHDICGFLTDVERYLGETIAAPSQLSVSFASYLAGVFLAAEILKDAIGLPSLLGGRYQIDPLASLIPEGPFEQGRSVDCMCAARPDLVLAVRSHLGSI
jgi:molybdopterin/thiamine biosynthesis adenylyltransferase